MTLIELLISFLILAIVCIGWLQIIGIQSAKREARRREAVERLAGIVDAFLDCNKDKYNKKKKNQNLKGCYAMQISNSILSFSSVGDSVLTPVFTNDETIVYRLCVVDGLPNNELFDNQNLMLGEWTSKKWLIGNLYEPKRSQDTLSDLDKPFFTLPVCLWF